MGNAILVLGYSSAGKSYSIRNMDPATTGVISVEKPRLPFNTNDAGQAVSFPILRTQSYQKIEDCLKKATKKSYIIDDSQYLLFSEWICTSREQGYNCYCSMAKSFYHLIHLVNDSLPETVNVYFFHHPEVEANGFVKPKTIGKILDEKLTLEGCFDCVLLAVNDAEGHAFLTESDGMSCVKTPHGMFTSPRIPNDLRLVDDAVRAYWGIRESK